MSADDLVLVDLVRSPMGRGKPGGALSGVHPVDLLGQVFAALIEQTGIDPATVDDAIVGCVTQVREQSACVGRQGWLAAGLPESVPSVTVDRRCGSGQQAIHFGAQAILSGFCDVVVAGGVESMSRVPILSNRLDADPFGEAVAARYAPGLVSQGVAAELVAAQWGIDRGALDEYSARSHELAAAAVDDGSMAREIVAIETPDGPVELDETIRRGTTAEKLGGLKPSFEDPAMTERFPQIEWGITAGNSSQLADGAAAALLMKRGRAEALGLRPRARLVSFALAGDDPLMMLTAPIPATRKLLERADVAVAEIDVFEVNEAFASVPLAWQAELGAPLERLNPRGGAIAFGHPLGASGVRLMASLVSALEQGGGRYGLQVMCEAGGQANATLIERLEG